MVFLWAYIFYYPIQHISEGTICPVYGVPANAARKTLGKLTME